MRMARCPKPRKAVADLTPMAIRSVLPARFAAARKLSGLNQGDAAVLMGFANSSMLSKIEGGDGSAGIHVVARASVVYAVSTDFLLGLSDYPEKDPNTVEQVAVMRAVRQTVTEQAAETMNKIGKFAAAIVPVRAHMEAIIKAAGPLYEQFCRAGSGAKGMAQSMETMMECVEQAQEYLRRKQLLTTREYSSDLNEAVQYPLLALIERQGQMAQDAAQESAGADLSETHG